MDPLKAPSTQETKLHFLDYWRIIRIRKTVILAVFLLVSVTATFVTFFLPVAYSSKATIKVERDSTDVQSVTGQPNLSGVYDPYFIQTEFIVIKSQVVLDKVIEKLNLNAVWAEKYQSPGKWKTSDTRRRLAGMIELRPERNTSLIDITVYSDNKDEAAKLAEAVAEVYRDYRLETRQKLIDNGIAAYTSELEKQGKVVTAKEAEVDALRSKYDVADTGAQSAAAAQSIEPMDVMHYNSSRIEAEIQYDKKETTLNMLKSLSREKLRQTLPTVSPDPILVQLLQEQIGTDTALVKMRNELGDQHPSVQGNEKLSAVINTKIEERVNGIMTALEAEVASLDAMRVGASNAVEKAKASDIKKAAETRPYWLAKEDLDRMKKFRDLLAIRSAQEEVEKRMPTTTIVEIINHAEPIERAVRPNKPLNITLGVIIGLVVGFGLAFFIEYLDTSVKTIDDVERTLQAPVLGVIPQNVGYLLEEGAESPHAEAYRVLRTNLMFSRKDERLNTIAVVSAGAGEGKSTTVINLATVFAQCGQRVLVVDSDLRRPTLHKLMGVSNNIGLTNYLLKQNTLEEVIQTTALGSLDFLPSGKLPSSSLGILNSAQMKDLINELKQRYDFVLFDSPPIMGVSDASILASEVDITLQVIQYRRYPQPMNIRAKQLIEKVGGNLIGIVLNNINMSQDENYYYYSGYYHEYYSKNEEESAAGANGTGEGKPRGDIKPKY
jgi:succinoglycan biosynthesis transport protein ExoP